MTWYTPMTGQALVDWSSPWTQMWCRETRSLALLDWSNQSGKTVQWS